MTELQQNMIPKGKADFFAQHQYTDYVIFQELLKIETVSSFRAVLEKLIESEYTDYQFWLSLSEKKRFSVPWHEIFFFKTLRRVCGLTFTAKFLERDEQKIIRAYQKFQDEVPEPLRSKVAEILAREQEHEQMLISQFREGKVEFLGSIILGLNDGIVELSGALVGFSITIADVRTIGFLGLITGVAAAFSMSSSAFLQARYDSARQPFRAATYTGISYLAVVALLVAPFFLLSEKQSVLAALAGIVFAIILFSSFYTSVVRERRFSSVAAEMIGLSIGVAVLIFALVQGTHILFR